jgi:hypothetical protein
MLMKTKRFKLEDIYPNCAAEFASKLDMDRGDLFLVRKSYKSIADEVQKKERSVVSRISSFEVDRDGEILDPQGLDQQSYRLNPVVLFGHDYKNPQNVIGKNAWIQLSPDKKSLIAKTIFGTHDFADAVFRAYTEDVGGGYGPLLNMWSVGFIPIEWEDDPRNFKAAKRLYKKWELLEYSAVPIGSNRSALSLGRSKGIITDMRLLDAIEIEVEKDIPEKKIKVVISPEQIESAIEQAVLNLKAKVAAIPDEEPKKRLSQKIGESDAIVSPSEMEAMEKAIDKEVEEAIAEVLPSVFQRVFSTKNLRESFSLALDKIRGRVR